MIMKKDFITLTDFTAEELQQIIKAGVALKKKLKQGEEFTPLKGKSLGMIFHKPSARTRISFDVGFFQLGGHPLLLSEAEIGFGKRESVGDLGQMFSRYLDAVMIRTYSHQSVIDLANSTQVPVINGLTDYNHPCQVMADLMTLSEYREDLKSLKIVFIGDGNNVCNSWFHAAGILGLNLTLTCPSGYEIPQEVWDDTMQYAKQTGATLAITHDPVKAVKNADVIYTDTWTSMGQEKEAETRRNAFKEFQVNKTLMAHCAEDYLVMHCLPAHRGEEITDEIIDSNHSIVFDEAENRLHAQKSIMVMLLAPEVFKSLL
jgi:ornithine carbamoyltransferase